MLIEKGANINMYGYVTTSLHYSIRSQNLLEVKAFLDVGAANNIDT